MLSLEQEWTGKIVIVTGGSIGIGRGCAEVFCEVGANVVICGRRPEIGEAAAKNIAEKNKGECVFFRCDVSKEADVKALVDFTVKKYGRLDAIINNAGYYPPEKPITEVTDEDVTAVFRTNFYGVFFGCKHAIPHLRRTKGAIVNVSSVESVTGMESAYAYTATKGAIDTFTKSLAIDEAKKGVRVNALRPGNIFTDMYYSNLSREENPEQYEAEQRRVQWMGRGGQPREMGTAALFLASNQMAGFVTGTTLLATGGYEIGESQKYLHMEWNTSC